MDGARLGLDFEAGNGIGTYDVFEHLGSFRCLVVWGGPPSCFSRWSRQLLPFLRGDHAGSARLARPFTVSSECVLQSLGIWLIVFVSWKSILTNEVAHAKCQPTRFC